MVRQASCDSAKQLGVERERIDPPDEADPRMRDRRNVSGNIEAAGGRLRPRVREPVEIDPVIDQDRGGDLTSLLRLQVRRRVDD